jgi:hypothetical protein
MILRRVIEHFKKQEWTAIFLDFVIVVVGVFVGVQVNGWVGDEVDRRREKTYLIALKNDFAVISAELEGDAAKFAAIAEKMRFLLDQSRLNEPSATTAELNAAVAELITMEGTPMVSGTYEAITGSGDLEIIRSKKVKDAMTSFFGRAEVVHLVGATHEAQLVDIFQPYIVANLDYPAMLSADRGMPLPGAFAPERVGAALKSDAFRNIIAVKWDISTDLRHVILIALDRAQKVGAALDEELDNS